MEIHGRQGFGRWSFPLFYYAVAQTPIRALRIKHFRNSLFMKSVLAATYQNLVHIYTHKSTFTFCNKKKSRFKFSTLLSLKLVSLNIVSQTHSSKKGNSLVDCNFYTYTKEVIQQLVTTIWNFTFFFSLS